MSKNLLLLGLPGVGKGTNAVLMAKDFNLPHISTGDIFRSAMANQTELGIKAKQYMDAGDLVPDEITNGIVAERLAEKDVLDADGFILDGYPRNTDQADFLNNFLKETNRKVDAVIYLEAPQDVVVKRLLGRGRADDTQEVVEHRINVAVSETMPLVDYFKKEGNLITINAVADEKNVYSKVKQAIESL